MILNDNVAIEPFMMSVVTAAFTTPTWLAKLSELVCQAGRPALTGVEPTHWHNSFTRPAAAYICDLLYRDAGSLAWRLGLALLSGHGDAVTVAVSFVGLRILRIVNADATATCAARLKKRHFRISCCNCEQLFKEQAQNACGMCHFGDTLSLSSEQVNDRFTALERVCIPNPCRLGFP